MPTSHQFLSNLKSLFFFLNDLPCVTYGQKSFCWEQPGSFSEMCVCVFQWSHYCAIPRQDIIDSFLLMDSVQFKDVLLTSILRDTRAIWVHNLPRWSTVWPVNLSSTFPPHFWLNRSYCAVTTLLYMMLIIALHWLSTLLSNSANLDTLSEIYTAA